MEYQSLVFELATQVVRDRTKNFVLRIVPEQFRGHQDNVLNGIANDSEMKRIFVTGKMWPPVYDIKIVQLSSPMLILVKRTYSYRSESTGSVAPAFKD